MAFIGLKGQIITWHNKHAADGNKIEYQKLNLGHFNSLGHTIGELMIHLGQDCSFCDNGVT